MIRIFDFVLAAIGVIVLAPLLVPIMIILRFTGEREVFYVQDRIGLGGERFGLLKFATMLKNSPSIGAGEITLKNDPRVLPFGQFLRKSKINELPQLFNILKGDISIVGARPMVPNTFALYPDEARDRLALVRPGLTGIGSIIFRDEEQFLNESEDPQTFYREIIIPYKAALEVWYLDKRSVQFYSLLIFLTAWVIVFPNSCLTRKAFPDLPSLPKSLKGNQVA